MTCTGVIPSLCQCWNDVANEPQRLFSRLPCRNHSLLSRICSRRRFRQRHIETHSQQQRQARVAAHQLREEARQADLLLHVVDASNPAALEQIAAVYQVLEELGIREKDTLLVLNQVDAIEEPGTLEILKQRYPHAIPISARTGEGIARLAAAVSVFQYFFSR